MSITVDAAGQSDVGKVREKNEDQFLVAELDKSMSIKTTTLPAESRAQLVDAMRGYLFLVADGMGGHTEGDVASELATFTVVRYVLGTLPWFHGVAGRRQEDVAADLVRALEKCESEVQAAAASDKEPLPMGTTLTMAYLSYPNLFVVNVGDSRCYLLRGSELHQITVDQTAAQELQERRLLGHDEAADSAAGSVLSQAIGGAEHGVDPDAYLVKVEPGDTVLLCTDGLSDQLPDPRIAEILGTGYASDETCANLVSAANDAGGADNVTAVVVRVLEMGT